MAKIDLTSREWVDMVFEGRNHGYGAYDMRMTSHKRHNKAMIITVILAVVGFSIPSIIKFVTPEQDKESMVEVTTLTNLKPAEVKNNEEIKRVENIPPPPLKSSIKFTAPVIKKDEEVPEADEMKSQDELQATKVTISIANVKGNDEVHGQDIADVKVIAAEAPKEDNKVYDHVEQNPQFPGGEQELLNFINKNIKYPVTAQEMGIEGRVILRFVVTKTGDVGEVTVLRSLDSACDKEAMRVIKSMPRWIPGKQNGNNVAVYYTVPVLFRLMK